jgi:hypothetical protein
LYISPLHPEEIIALTSFFALLNHTVPMCQLSVQDITEDFGIAMRMCWEASACVDTVFVEDSQTAKVLKSRIVVVCEAECVVRVEPAMVSVSSLVGSAGHDFGVGKSFRHSIFDGRYCAHGFS